jgi:molecular chaperone GrpE (heat shock protein)
MQSSNEFTAVAGVVSEFLPVLDELQRLKALYEGDAFGKNYNAMAGNLQTALLELGVEEYAIPVGSPVDGRRVVVVDTEYSDKFAKNTIVRPLKLGLEIKGNVVRLAECVASLGSEAEAAAAAAAAEAKKATKDAPTDEANDEKN